MLKANVPSGQGLLEETKHNLLMAIKAINREINILSSPALFPILAPVSRLSAGE